MRISWIFIVFLGAGLIQAVISEEESQQDQEEEDQESASQEQYDSEQQPPEEQDQQQQQRQQQTQEDSPPLPPGMELVDPKQLGLSDGDVSKYFGNVKHLQTLNLPGYGSKTQILSVGFDDKEKFGLQNFEDIPTTGLGEQDKNVAQNAFQQFQSMFGSSEEEHRTNESLDLDSLTTLFTRNPKVDVLQSLELFPPLHATNEISQQHSSSSQKQEQFNKHHQLEGKDQEQQQHEKKLHQSFQGQVFYQPPFGQFPQQYPYSFYPMNHVHQPFYFPQHPAPFAPQFIPLPAPPAPTVQPQLVHIPGPNPANIPKSYVRNMPPVLVAQPSPFPQALIRGPPPTLHSQQQFAQVRPVTQPPVIMQIPTAQPQFVQIRQKGEVGTVSSASSAASEQQVVQQQHHQPIIPQQFINPQYLQQFQRYHQPQPQLRPTPAPYELNYAHQSQSQPIMVINNPPELGHTSFLDFLRGNPSKGEQSGLQEIISNSIEATPSQSPQQSLQQFHPGTANVILRQTLPVVGNNEPLQYVPQQFSTIYKQQVQQTPTAQVPQGQGQSKPLLKQLQEAFQAGMTMTQQNKPGRLRQSGTHYQGRHIAIRRPLRLDFSNSPGPAFGTQQPFTVQNNNNRRQPIIQTEPNSFMMAPSPSPSTLFPKSSSRPPPLALHQIQLQPQAQQLHYQAVLPNSHHRREPKPSMPLIHISSPENAMPRSKFFNEMIHAFGNKLS